MYIPSDSREILVQNVCKSGDNWAGKYQVPMLRQWQNERTRRCMSGQFYSAVHVHSIFITTIKLLDLFLDDMLESFTGEN